MSNTFYLEWVVVENRGFSVPSIREIFSYNDEIQAFTKEELAGAAFEIGPVAFAEISF